MGSTPRSIQSLLHTASPDIADLIGRAHFFDRMRAAILEMLPDAARPHVQVAAYDNCRLRLHASSGAWATRLRYMQPVIIQSLAQRMRLHVESVEVRVRLDTSAPGFEPRPRFVSAAACVHIRRSAHYIRDPELAAALERLAAAGRSG